MKLIDFPQLFILYDAMQKTRDFEFENKCLQILHVGMYRGRMLFFLQSLQLQVLFEGGPYMRKYGTRLFQISVAFSEYMNFK